MRSTGQPTKAAVVPPPPFFSYTALAVPENLTVQYWRTRTSVTLCYTFLNTSRRLGKPVHFAARLMTSPSMIGWSEVAESRWACERHSWFAESRCLHELIAFGKLQKQLTNNTGTVRCNRSTVVQTEQLADGRLKTIKTRILSLRNNKWLCSFKKKNISPLNISRHGSTANITARRGWYSKQS